MLTDVGERPAYPSDLSDEAGELTRPVLTAWKAKRPAVSGHAGRYGMREIVNAILCQARTGCQWRCLPHDLPPGSAVYHCFGAWRDDGTAETIPGLLRRQVREGRRRHGAHRGRPGLMRICEKDQARFRFPTWSRVHRRPEPPVCVATSQDATPGSPRVAGDGEVVGQSLIARCRMVAQLSVTNSRLRHHM